MKKRIYNLIKKAGYLILHKEKPSHKYIKSIIGDKEIIVAEIGTWDAENALEMLEYFNIKKLYIIDPYLDYDGFEIMGSITEAEKQAKKRLSKYKDKIVWIKKKSDDAVDEIPDNLDLIYIDGNHEYKFVKNDLNNYFPKINKDGFLFGHDVANIIYPGVIKAYFEFCIEKNITPMIAREDFIINKRVRKP